MAVDRNRVVLHLTLNMKEQRNTQLQKKKMFCCTVLEHLLFGKHVFLKIEICFSYQPIFLTFKLNIDSASLSSVALKILSTFTVRLGETVNAVRHAFLKKTQQHSIIKIAILVYL